MEEEKYFNYFEEHPQKDPQVEKSADVRNTRLWDIKQRVRDLLQTSKDPEFSNYLVQMQKRLDRQELQIHLLEDELTQRTKLYENSLKLQVDRAISSAMNRAEAPVMPVAEKRTAPVPEKKPKRDVEFAVGATVLGVTGSAFILIALMLLGMYFMQGFMKGMLLYAVCAGVLLLSELVLYRKWRGLGITISALAMTGFYITTLVNYYAMMNFNQFVAIGITLAITIFILFLSRKRDAVFYRILGMVAVYTSMFILVGNSENISGYINENSVNGSVGWLEIVTVILMAFIVNSMCILVPMRKRRTEINIVHMCLNTVFTLICYIVWVWRDGDWGYFAGIGQMWKYFAFVGVSFLTQQILYVQQVRFQEKQFPGEHRYGIYIVYSFSIPAYMLMFTSLVRFESLIMDAGFSGGFYPLVRIVGAVVVATICGLSMALLRGSNGKWFIWYMLNALIISDFVGVDNGWEFALYLLVLLIASKAVSFTRSKMAAVSDAFLTIFACIYVLARHEELYAVPLAVCLLLSAVCIVYWKAFFQTLLSYTLAFYVSMFMIPMFKLPVFVGALFVGILAYNYIKKWNSKGIVVFNILVLIGQTAAYLGLLNPVYRNAYLTYICMLIFGIATIEMCFQKRCHMPVKGKELIMAGFLTYMGLVVKTSYPIVNSILLMIVSISCVVLGFAIQKKGVRIYGLVLSLLICAKLVLYDFAGVNLLQKTILFFAVGILALTIATIYMILEHKLRKQEEAE